MRSALLLALLLPWTALAEDASAATYKVGAGDTLRLEVYGEDDLSREVRISASCAVEVPLIGSVPVCGLTTDEVAERVKVKLADGYLQQPTVFVGVASYGSQRVSVKGEVKEPGVHVLEGPTTLSELITMAGGPTSANVIRVQLVTETGPVEYDLSDLDGQRDPVWVAAGQTVVLLPPVTVQVFGEVKTSGPVAYQAGLTATEALGLAGGATDMAGLGRTYILRADGQTKVRVNLRRIQQGKEPDVQLLPDDQLVIRRSIF